MKNSKKLALIFAASLLIGGKAFAQESENDNHPIIENIEENILSDNSSVMDKYDETELITVTTFLTSMHMEFSHIRAFRDKVRYDVEQAIAISKNIEGYDTELLFETIEDYKEIEAERLIELAQLTYSFITETEQPIDTNTLNNSEDLIQYCLSDVKGCTPDDFDDTADKTYADIYRELTDAINEIHLINSIHKFERLKEYLENDINEDVMTSKELTEIDTNIIGVVSGLYNGDYSVLDTSGNKDADEMGKEYNEMITAAFIKAATSKMQFYYDSKNPDLDMDPFCPTVPENNIEDILDKNLKVAPNFQI